MNTLSFSVYNKNGNHFNSNSLLMGAPANHQPVMLVTSFISRHPDAIQWGLEKSKSIWGKISIQSDPFLFSETDYYAKSMGIDLSLVLVVYTQFIDPTTLPGIKLQTNSFEEEIAELYRYAEKRPLNIDPGYLTLAKFVLATTKDASHRLYLGDGIFGEITLKYVHKKWQDQPWTYPNYKRGDYKEFLLKCRKQLGHHLLNVSKD